MMVVIGKNKKYIDYEMKNEYWSYNLQNRNAYNRNRI